MAIVPFDLGHEYRRFSLSDIYGPDSDPEDVSADDAGLLLTPELATFDLPDVTLCSVRESRFFLLPVLE